MKKMAEKKPKKKKAPGKGGGEKVKTAGRKTVKTGVKKRVKPNTQKTAKTASTKAAKDTVGKKRSTSRSSKLVAYDPVSAYYQDVRHYPVLTREEEKELAIQYLETEDIDAAYGLVTSNLRLVIKIALEYRKLWREGCGKPAHPDNSRCAEPYNSG